MLGAEPGTHNTLAQVLKGAVASSISLGLIFGSVLAEAVPVESGPESFDVRVLAPIRSVDSHDRALYTYELVVTNFSTGSLTVTSLVIADPQTGQIVANYAAAELSQRFTRVGDSHANSAEPELTPGRSAIIYVELEVPKTAPINSLRQTFTYGNAGSVRALTLPVVAVSKQSPAVLAPPMKAGRWVAVHAPDWERGHRRAIYALAGVARIPGRYAIDFLGVDHEGHTTKGMQDRAADAVGYDEPVFAGGDGTVAAVRNDVSESVLIHDNGRHPLADAAGNYVCLKLGDGVFVFYEHLRPASSHLHVGQRIHVGEVIGRVGFSGDSTGPHLHMHVADGPDPLSSNGLPFVLSHYVELGRYDKIDDLGTKPWSLWPRPRSILREWPYYDVVIHF